MKDTNSPGTAAENTGVNGSRNPTAWAGNPDAQAKWHITQCWQSADAGDDEAETVTPSSLAQWPPDP